MKQYENTLKHKDRNTICSLTSPSLKAKGFYAQLDKINEKQHFNIYHQVK